MRKVLFASLILSLSASAAYPFCLQPAPPSICAEYFRSSLVVQGTALSRRHLTVEQMGEGAGSDGELYTFSVDIVYRGKAGKTIQLVDKNDSGRIAFSVQTGDKYLLFLFKAPENNQWYAADGCGNSGSSKGQPKTLGMIKSFEHSTGGGLIEVKVSEGPGLAGPLADFPVTLTGAKSFKSKTDKDGWARFKVPLGNYAASASKPGWTAVQYDLSYESADHIHLTEHGQCSQLQLVAEPH
jgi:hypothetical protein